MDPATVLLANMDSRLGRRLRIEGVKRPAATVQGRPILVDVP